MKATSEISNPALSAPLPDLAKLTSAIGSVPRWKMLKELSCGEARTVFGTGGGGRLQLSERRQTSGRVARGGPGGAWTRKALPVAQASFARARPAGRGLRSLPAPAGCGGVKFFPKASTAFAMMLRSNFNHHLPRRARARRETPRHKGKNSWCLCALVVLILRLIFPDPVAFCKIRPAIFILRGNI